MKDINTFFEQAKTILDDCNISYGTITEVKINSRAKSRWGMSRYIGNNKYIIEISDELLQDSAPDWSTLDTMVHELLHCSRDRRGHKGEWKRCANIINAKYDMHIQRASSIEEKGVDRIETSRKKEEFKYIITCDLCKSVWRYKRHSRTVQIIECGEYARCPKCGSHDFTLERRF